MQTLKAAMKDAGVETSQLDWLVLHQANQRILDAAAQRLGVPPERVVSNLAEYGNTSAASIPLVLDEAVRAGKIKSGDMVCHCCNPLVCVSNDVLNVELLSAYLMSRKQHRQSSK